MVESNPVQDASSAPEAVIVSKSKTATDTAGTGTGTAEKSDGKVESASSVNKPSRSKKVYTKFQYRDQIFKVGDVCRFFQEANVPDLLGKIMSICSTDTKHPDFAKIKVRWFYQKRDLFRTKLSKEELTQVAEDVELFPTNHYQNVYVQTINGKVKIVSLEDFEQLAPVPNDTFFSRAEFDPKKKLFKPDYSEWPSLCSCKKPQNPLQTYIACDVCEQWFHPECQGTAATVEEFTCKDCTKKK